jgi:preprotein translocase subunit YajC
MNELLLNLAQLGPIVALLIVAILYFLKREQKKDLEIEALHKELRENEKESLTALLKLSALIDKMLDADATKNKLLIVEIQAMKLSIEAKIDALNK